MKPKLPIEIDLLEFFKNGTFSNLKLGQTKEWILAHFPKPDSQFDEEMLKNGCDVWTYGDIELHFREEKLFLIFSDNWWEKNLSGGKKLKLKKWIFEDLSQLDLQFVTKALKQQNIDYKKKINCLGVLLRLNSGVEITFENTQDIEDLDTNDFQLTSFGLVEENPNVWGT